MSKYTITKTFTFYDADILSVIEAAVYDIGYWSCIDNDRNEWYDAKAALEKEATFEDLFFHILRNGEQVQLFDVEDEDEIWFLTLDKLLHGMKLAIDNGDWDGDVDSLDGDIGDMIFQYALFDEIVFG